MIDLLDLLKDELNLLDKLEWGNTRHMFSSETLNYKLDYDPDIEFRNEINIHEDIPCPQTNICKSNRIVYNYEFADDIINSIIKKLQVSLKEENVDHRGIYYYPPGSRCGWHTNSNSPGKRIYLTWAQESNKSFFKYYDYKLDKIITKYDKKGWQINEFVIPKEGLFWHYVGSHTTRKSIGFQF